MYPGVGQRAFRAVAVESSHTSETARKPLLLFMRCKDRVEKLAIG
jgi:hypothetical protein